MSEINKHYLLKSTKQLSGKTKVISSNDFEDSVNLKFHLNSDANFAKQKFIESYPFDHELQFLTT